MWPLFAILTGMFKALRDRDEWHAENPNESDYIWLWSMAWYRQWSKTARYWLSFPLDAWHNFDVANMICSFTAGYVAVLVALGLDFLFWPYLYNLTVFLGFALSSKWLFYHVLLMRNPRKELEEYFGERLK